MAAGEKNIFEKNKEFNLTCNNQAVWEGKVEFKDMLLGPDYYLLIYIQKYLPYKLFQITLTEGNNDLDFSDTVNLVGDIKGDEVINSYDLSFIRNNLFSQEKTLLDKADLNFDGIINAVDFSLAISGLKEQE